MSTEAKTTKDIFAVYQHNVDRFLDVIKQSVPRYHQSVTNAQQEYVDIWENITSSAISLQKEFVKKTGLAINMPEATLRITRDSTEEFIKGIAIQNQIMLASIDIAYQNLKSFNDNTKTFADLNKNILQSLISLFTPKSN